MAEEVQLTPEQKKLQFQKRAKLGLMLGAGLLFAPIAVLTIGGLIGLGIAALIAVVGINAAPVVAMKLANWKMKSLMQEARDHPIETMTVIYIDNIRTIKAGDEKIHALATRLLDFRGKAKGFAEKYPQRAAQYAEMIDYMQQVLDRWKEKQRVAKAEAKAYADKIEEGKAVYEMGKEAAGLQELTGDLEKQVTQNILKQVSFDEINHTFNSAVASLSMEVDTEPDFSLDQKNKAAALSFHSKTPSRAVQQIESREVVKEKEFEA